MSAPAPRDVDKLTATRHRIASHFLAWIHSRPSIQNNHAIILSQANELFDAYAAALAAMAQKVEDIDERCVQLEDANDEALELLRDLFNDATDARRVDEYRARGEERIPAFISVEYLDRVRAAIDAARKASDEPRSP